MHERVCLIGPMTLAAHDYYNHANTEATAHGENIFSKICSEAACLRLLSKHVYVLLACLLTSSATHYLHHLPSCVELNAR